MDFHVVYRFRCEWQVTSAVAALMAVGADPNQTSSNSPTPPLVLAALKVLFNCIFKIKHQF